MGDVRATILHSLETMKLKSQINQNVIFYENLFKEIHYSIISNSLERGIQFGLYEKFKLNDGNLVSSTKVSLISTTVSFPYNVILLRNVVMNSLINISKSILYKSLGLDKIYVVQLQFYFYHLIFFKR